MLIHLSVPAFILLFFLSFLAPLLLLELLSYWHALNGHSSVPISGSACAGIYFFLSFFFYHSLYSIYFAIDLNGEMLIGQNESHDYSADWLKMETNCPSVKRND